MVLRVPTFSTCQNIGQYGTWCQTQSSLHNSRDTVTIHLLRISFPAAKRYNLKITWNTNRRTGFCSPAFGQVKVCFTLSPGTKASLPLPLPREPGKLVPNAAWLHSVIRMAHGKPTAYQTISKLISLSYYTCLAQFEWGSLRPPKVLLPVICTCTHLRSKYKHPTKPYFRSLFKSEETKPI